MLVPLKALHLLLVPQSRIEYSRVHDICFQAAYEYVVYLVA